MGDSVVNGKKLTPSKSSPARDNVIDLTDESDSPPNVNKAGGSGTLIIKKIGTIPIIVSTVPKSQIPPPGKSNTFCEFCQKDFRDNYKYKRHMLIHTNEKPHGCSYCDKRFRRLEHLRRHLATYGDHSRMSPSTGNNGVSQYRFQCQICGIKTISAGILQKHILEDHAEGLKKAQKPKESSSESPAFDYSNTAPSSATVINQTKDRTHSNTTSSVLTGNLSQPSGTKTSEMKEDEKLSATVWQMLNDRIIHKNLLVRYGFEVVVEKLLQEAKEAEQGSSTCAEESSHIDNVECSAVNIASVQDNSKMDTNTSPHLASLTQSSTGQSQASQQDSVEKMELCKDKNNTCSTIENLIPEDCIKIEDDDPCNISGNILNSYTRKLSSDQTNKDGDKDPKAFSCDFQDDNLNSLSKEQSKVNNVGEMPDLSFNTIKQESMDSEVSPIVIEPVTDPETLCKVENAVLCAEAEVSDTKEPGTVVPPVHVVGLPLVKLNLKKYGGKKEKTPKTKLLVNKTSLSFLSTLKKPNKVPAACSSAQTFVSYLKGTEKFRNFQPFNRKIKKFNTPYEFFCKLCSEVFTDYVVYREHKVACPILNCTYKPFECKICLRRFLQSLHLQSHMEKWHDVIMYYGCPNCDGLFVDINDVNLHNSLNHPSKSTRINRSNSIIVFKNSKTGELVSRVDPKEHFTQKNDTLESYKHEMKDKVETTNSKLTKLPKPKNLDPLENYLLGD